MDKEIFLSKKLLLNPHKYWLGIRDPGSWIRKKHIPDLDPVVKKGTCAAKAFCYCPAIISHRPGSQNTSKEPQLNPEKDSRRKKGQIACNFGEIIIKLQAVGIMSQTKPHP